MMAHKLPKVLGSLFMTSRSSPRVRLFAPLITESQTRSTVINRAETLCRYQSSWWSSSHTRRPRLCPFVNTGRYPRESIDLVPAASSLISCQWQGGRESVHARTLFSNTPHLTPRSHQWEGAQVSEEDCHRGTIVSRTADTGLTNPRRQEAQNSVQLPLINHLDPTAPSSVRDRPHRRRRNNSAMPRSGYDTTNMRVAAKPRLAGSAGGKGPPRNDKPRRDGHSDGRGRNGSGGSGQGKDGGQGDDEKGSKNTEEQEPERGGKDDQQAIKSIIPVRRDFCWC